LGLTDIRSPGNSCFIQGLEAIKTCFLAHIVSFNPSTRKQTILANRPAQRNSKGIHHDSESSHCRCWLVNAVSYLGLSKSKLRRGVRFDDPERMSRSWFRSNNIRSPRPHRRTMAIYRSRSRNRRSALLHLSRHHLQLLSRHKQFQ